LLAFLQMAYGLVYLGFISAKDEMSHQSPFVSSYIIAISPIAESLPTVDSILVIDKAFLAAKLILHLPGQKQWRWQTPDAVATT
jgi:hypothetical protein